MAKGTNYPNGLSSTKRDKGLGQANVVRKVKVIRVDYTDGTAETDTTFDLPTNGYVHEVLVDVKTAEATGTTKTIDVGLLSSETGGDANGFAVGVSVASTGLKRPQATVTAGATETYFSATTRGALLATLLAGADVAGDVGTNYEFPHHIGSVTAKSISWTPGSADFAELVADIIIVYDDIGADS